MLAFERDHVAVGSEAAFFRDNIRRHVITGRSVECVLNKISQLPKDRWGQGKGTYTPGKNWSCG